jgi:hypothetical protein
VPQTPVFANNVRICGDSANDRTTHAQRDMLLKVGEIRQQEAGNAADPCDLP